MYEKIYYKNKVVDAMLYKTNFVYQSLTSIGKKLFANGEQGFFYDPNDLTAEKINWRKNQLLNTEDFTYGASGNYTAVKEADGWALTAIAQTVTGYALLGIQYPIGAASDSRGAGTVVRSIEVKKGTGVFRFGAASNSTALFVDAATMTAIGPPSGLPYTITAIGSDWYQIETFFYQGSLGSSTLSNYLGWSTAKATSATLDTTNQVGTVIRVRNPSFAFVPYETTKSIPYQAISDFNSDFIRAFPLHTLYQDAVGNVPVTGVGQAVWHILDKSGNNNHAFATSSATRPILRKNATTGANYLEFDGSDDFLQTNNIDFTNTDKVSLFAGVRKLSDATAGTVLEFSNVIINPGTFALHAPNANNSSNYSARVNGEPSLIGNAIKTGYNAPHSAVLTASVNLGSIDNKKVSLRVNSSDTSYNGESVNTGMLGNYPLYIGRRAGTTLPFTGHIYGLIGIGKLTTDSETVAMEKELAKRIGVTLNV